MVDGGTNVNNNNNNSWGTGANNNSSGWGNTNNDGWGTKATTATSLAGSGVSGASYIGATSHTGVDISQLGTSHLTGTIPTSGFSKITTI